ncbi:MAG: VWA domain-containing protein [Arenimonas sp.]|nr:VWA domain-containing protein [Arenimonas sp.]
MRLSPLCLAVSLSLLGACNQQPTRVELEAETKDSAAASAVVEFESADAAKAEGQTRPAAVNDALHESSIRQNAPSAMGSAMAVLSPPPPSSPAKLYYQEPSAVAPSNTENYAGHEDNPIQRVAETPVSTFSIDVDTGSYSNVRRMLMAGQRPPADAVRAEEMINYFDYGYPAPASRDVPFRVSTEIARAPWNARHQLLQIGIQGYRVSRAEIPASNIVFLIDTSGSMQDQDKLPLLKLSFRELVKQLRPQDRVSVVVYAGSAGLVLPPTPGNEQQRILAALDQLEAGGSTNGGEGLKLAYAMARQAFIRDGVNRVVLATDGDFNVGTFDQKALETMIGDQRKSGIALTTLGFGTGNYNDAMAEQLADIGNGNHAYIDSIDEGRRVLVEEMASTMLTIAQDVKIQLEFNPALVAEYRLIGYENRALRREDFNNDRVDAGEIGAGHDVTALYEITLVDSGGESVDPLRYRKPDAASTAASNELGWLRLRYKQPGSESSRLIESALTRGQIKQVASPRLRWSAAVAAYADLLRGGGNVGAFDWNQVRSLAASAGGDDRWGYRAGFLDLVDRARAVTSGDQPVAVNE